MRLFLSSCLALAVATAFRPSVSLRRTGSAVTPSKHTRLASATTDAFSDLYPPAEVALRNAASRTDGYWPFVSNGEEPPLVLTYGEFPLPFFDAVVDKCCAHAGLEDDRRAAVLCDIGSGSGRLTLWAATSQRPWGKVVGVEVLPALHRTAREKQEALGARTTAGAVEIIEGSFDDPDALAWQDIDIAFAYTTAFPRSAEGVLEDLTAAPAPPAGVRGRRDRRHPRRRLRDT